jgi:hypothetical protein
MRDIPGAHQMLGVRPAGGVLERALLETEFMGALGHLFGKRFLRPREPLGEDDTRIVARLNDDAAQQIFHAYLRVDLHEHLRAALAPSLA